MPNEELTRKVADLERLLREHLHNGAESQELSIASLVDNVPTVSAAPSHTPKRFVDQFRIYKNGTTYRFYWYDYSNAEWRYATGA